MEISWNKKISSLTDKLISDTNIEERRRIAMHYIISFVGIIFLFAIGTIAIFQKNITLACVDYAMAIFFIYLYAIGGVSGSAFVWYFTYPLLACYLLGSFYGIILSFLMSLPVIMIIFTGSQFPFIEDYQFTFEVRFLRAYFVVGIFAYFFEIHGERLRKDLMDVNMSLEQIVDERTAELTTKNKLLLNEIEEKIELQKERERVEAKLLRAQKMEAIGTLAGGVAHDLNNVLSGIVSYPELILHKLDKDDPLRKPLQTIQDSGQKAADIVQDLLTLTRRGVNLAEILDINTVIQEYLGSLEYRKLMSYHQNIQIHTDLSQNSLTINGSAIHIRKTIMNLITNAAEAQPDGGDITLSAYLHKFHFAKGGYGKFREEDFVTVKISDNGHGVSEEDKERIFEPFYTKKMMGRSGSGLGMAVVWGTVQDHHGIIDIESSVGDGTTFYLYLPHTRESIPQDMENNPISQYLGSGQEILIVDDSEEQRLITQKILERLNYTASVAASGEEAVEHLKHQVADLLILDMIMDPGMDGLDTYKEILKTHPTQKAIIASGFAETERVKELQRLGAGQFIKKPYMMDTIAVAVQNELNSTTQ